MTFFLKADAPMTAPLPGARRGSGAALYRSVFNLSDRPTIIGERTSAGAGLTVGTWEGTAAALAISGNAAVRGTGTGTWSNGLALADTGAMLSLKVVNLPTVDNLYFDLFRDSFVGQPDAYRLVLTPTGAAQLARRVGGANSYIGSVFNVVAGDRIGLRWVGGVLDALLNNTVVDSVVNSDVQPRGYAAISGLNATTGFILDDIEVDTY